MKRTAIDLKAIIRQEGLRYTSQREAVWQELLSTDNHRDAENIYFKLREHGLNVSRATVYRTIEILVKHNLIRKLDLGDGKSRYEHHQDQVHHDHLICTECGRIVEFVNEPVEKLQQEIAAEFNFELSDHIHQLFGVCSNCSSNGNPAG
ncbi:MAG: transcriptional repressor [Candidatus Neomarinimicrobiota bacterium]